MITSSPTISQPPSPNTTFHTPSHRPYHASRRTSASSSAPSPRFAVTTAAARRFDAPPTPKPAFSAPSPVPSFVPSPQGRKRSYVDHGTQYTPPGFPPTYRSQPAAADSRTSTTTGTAVSDHLNSAAHTTAEDPLSAPAIAPIPRGTPSAAPAVTEPPEPQLRVPPQPAAPAQNVVSQVRPASREGVRPAVESDLIPTDASIVLPASPAKRARPQEPNVKVMPLQYETCDVKDLGVLISDMLMELVRLNDGYPLRDGTLTRFHSRYVCCCLSQIARALTDHPAS